MWSFLLRLLGGGCGACRVATIRPERGRVAITPRTASRRRRYNQAALWVWLCSLRLGASGATRASNPALAATKRLKPMTSGRDRRGGRDVKRRDRKGAKEESAQVGARQAAGVASAACGGKRSHRMVTLGQRIGGGGVSADNRSRLHRSARRSRSGTQAPARRSRPLALEEFRHQGVAGCPRWNWEDEEQTRT